MFVWKSIEILAILCSINLTVRILVLCQISNSISGSKDLYVESFTPCRNDLIEMTRYIGLPAEEQNYWNGSLKLYKYPGIPEANIHIGLDSSATVEVHPDEARVNNLAANEFMMITFSVPPVFHFVVRAPFGKPFPNLHTVELNGAKVCKRPKKWDPTLSGPQAEVAGVALVAPTKRVPPCGRRKNDFTPLVVGSKKVREGDWPWHVALYRKKPDGNWTYRCGGSIVSKTSIVTAGHCVVGRGPMPASTLKVVVGKHHLNTNDTHAKEIAVESVIVNFNFVLSTLRSDLAVLKLADEIVYNDYVQPICLWNPKQKAKKFLFGKYGTIVGWGANGEGRLAEELYYGSVRVVSDPSCLLSLPSFFSKFLNDNTFCAGNGPKNGTNACNGDSGGGLIFPIVQADNQESWFLRGIVSVSVSLPTMDLCDPDHYVVFTDTAQYLDWIHEKAGTVRYEDMPGS